MQTIRNLVLASSSPRRRELLSTLGLSFSIAVSDVDETTPSNYTPTEIVESLAVRKAEKIAGEMTNALVLGSDTIVVLETQVLGKPKDEADAFRMLTMLQGREHTVYSGVAIVDAKTNRQEVSSSSTKVKIRPLLPEEIEAYIKTGEPMDKAGSYAIQGIGATIVEGIEGDYFTVVGLPLLLTAQLLKRFDVKVL
ncbi:Maf family protein [Brevibacillus ginsengisoli]|uniref:Maf family protein n=1 Tax=Brevibacillus ginsengisoli TaxID=363854 RepID=UPI003CF66E5B